MTSRKDFTDEEWSPQVLERPSLAETLLATKGSLP